MALANLGSLANQINSLIENIPTAISGAALLQLIDTQRVYVEDYTGLTIGSTAIQDRFQPVILNLTISELLNFMQLQGADVSSVSLGDFSVSKGASSNLSDASKIYREKAMEQLKSLGWRFSTYQSL